METNIKVSKDGVLVVTGILSFATVVALQNEGCKLMRDGDCTIFDLKQVNVEDNSGLALLVEWVKCAKQDLGKPIHFINVPNQLLDIAKLSGLENILPIK